MAKKKNKKQFSFLQLIRDTNEFMSWPTKLLLGLGLFFIFIPSLFYLNQTIQLAFFTPKVVAIKSIYAAPITITIPSVNIQLPIEETGISNGVWSISDKGASHLAISARPGEKGPIIVYGHNTNDRFGPIRWLSEGQNIMIATADGKTHTYVIQKTFDVNPQQTDIFTKTTDETLYLYTCDGFADLQRFVVVAKPA